MQFGKHTPDANNHEPLPAPELEQMRRRDDIHPLQKVIDIIFIAIIVAALLTIAYFAWTGDITLPLLAMSPLFRNPFSTTKRVRITNYYSQRAGRKEKSFAEKLIELIVRVLVFAVIILIVWTLSIN